MKLAKPLSHTNDVRHGSERETYLAHCSNIAHIIATSGTQKPNIRQQLVDLYLTSVNTETEA